MARRSNADMEKTKQLLLEEGVLLLQESGYNATGIQEIAASASIPKGSFYNYFASKEDFAAEVIRYYASTSLATWRKALGEAKTEDAAQALYASFLAAVEKYRCLELKKGCLLGTLAAEISEASDVCRVALQESIEAFQAVVTEYLAAGQAAQTVRCDVEAKALAAVVWDAWQGSLLRMKVSKSVEPVQQDLKILFDVLLQPQAK